MVAVQAQRGLVKDLKPCSRVLDFAVDACRTAFFEHQAEEAGENETVGFRGVHPSLEVLLEGFFFTLLSLLGEACFESHLRILPEQCQGSNDFFCCDDRTSTTSLHAGWHTCTPSAGFG